MFENPLIAEADWPKLAETPFKPLPEAYAAQRKVVAGLFTLLLSAAAAVPWVVTAFEVEVPGGLRWGALLAGAVLIVGAWLQAVVGYRYMGYAVRRHDVTFKSGWLFRTRVTVPMSRIQHSEIFRGPLDRWLGLSTLRIFTAGSSGANLSIPGLHDETAQAIRSTLINHGAQH